MNHSIAPRRSRATPSSTAVGRLLCLLRGPLLLCLLGWVLLGGALLGCEDQRSAHTDDLAAADLSLPAPGDLAVVERCDDAGLCASAELCHLGVCIPDNGGCRTDEDCQNDTYCDCPGAPDGGGGDGASAAMADGGSGPSAACVCVPWGLPPRAAFDSACRAPKFPAAEVSPPTVLCATGGGTETTPLVADLDGDGKPEIIFSDVGAGFHAVHGADCSPYFLTDFGFAEWNASQLAVADLDGDGVPEIVGSDRGNRLAVFDNHGRWLASTLIGYGDEDAEAELGGPVIGDLDGRLPAEIIVAAQAVRYTSKPMPLITELWRADPHVAYWGSLTTLADLDGDRRPEVIVGKQIYQASTGMEITPAALSNLSGPGAFTAVADFNHDGHPDLVIVQSGGASQRVSVYDVKNQKFLFGPIDNPHPWGGPPTVADFDGDGEPEFGVASIHDYTVYDLGCLGDQRPMQCDQTTPGVLFRKTIADNSSGSCGAAAFDLNGDGAAEVIYRDECWLRAYDGRTGETLFSLPAPSGTGLEEPVVADLDDDGHAEIIVSIDGYPSCAKSVDPDTGAKFTDIGTGIVVLTDPRHRYMPARPLWNEHTYHIGNIKDDLSVPLPEKDSWTSWNSYRMQVQGIAGEPAGIGDFTAHKTLHPDDSPMDCTAVWTLGADLCNRGAGTAQKGVPGTFYLGDPSAGLALPLCTATTTVALEPGACQTVSCNWQKPTVTRADLWFRAADDGTHAHVKNECKQANDLLVLRNSTCHQLQ